MGIFAVIGIIILIAVIFVGGGLLGWLLKGLGAIFSFLMDGCRTSMGCLLWVVIIFFLLLALV